MDKPTIQYITEEAVVSGIEDVLIITSRRKWSIEEYYDRSLELEANLEGKGKLEQLELVKSISRLANIHCIRRIKK